MNWLESQIETRTRKDLERTERAYAKLAASVGNSKQAPLVSEDDIEQIDNAVRVCLKHCGVQAGEVPPSVKNVEERVDWLCRPTGTMRRKVRLTEGWQNRAFGAMLGSLDTGEPIALIPRGVRGYYYRQPGTSRKIRVTREVAKHVTEDAELFYKPFPAEEMGIRSLILFILRVFDRNDYLLVIGASLAVTLMGLVPAWANRVAFGIVVPSGQASLILPIGLMLLGVAVSTSLMGICRNLLMQRISTKLDIVAEAATFSRVLALPTSFFKQYSSGDLGSRISSVTMLSMQLTTIALGSALSASLSLVYILQISIFAPQLAIPALLVCITQAVLTVIVTQMNIRYEQVAMETSTKLSGTVTALLNGIQKIKLAGAEDRAFAKWADGYAKYAQAEYNRPNVLRTLPSLVMFTGLIGNITIYYLAGTTGVSVADYMAFNTSYGQVTGAIMALAGIAGQLAQIRPLLDVVRPILEAFPETSEDKPSVESLSGSVEMSDVSFRYDENAPYVLEGLSLRIKPGEYVALVGESGSGKSTILRLMLGFEKPELGAIFYGRYDVQKVDLRSLRQHIGVVMQNGSLFMGDLFSNITISSPSATLDDAWEAAEIAGMADDINNMPMGMQTLVTEGGGGISGGQRQRILIARAVCSKPRILMMDEATSALDNKTQKHVIDSLDSLKCTRVVVAHRLSTVKHCDRILVIDEGKVAEEGTYEELMKKGGIFSKLVERQRLDEEA
ncbi:MAG: ATP-binding cassette domain-containing protein [Atopobiaceae bacterium]|nr:ATP-binding cassette domain-containing protein [Atopobiaceae bacterium]